MAPATIATMRRTKIVCTLGPAVDDEGGIEALARAGMDCARLNFSHGTHEEHAARARAVREAAARLGRPIALLADLCGPKIRIGRFAEGPVELREGEPFELHAEPVEGDERRVSTSFAGLPEAVAPGDMVLLDDGLVQLRVTEVAGPVVHTEVVVGGVLSDRKGLNVPGAELPVAALTDKDKADLRFAVEELRVDYLALSFVQRPEDVLEAKALGGQTPVIAKIERPAAVERLEAILDAADGAMVARGDLGVELGPEKVPLVQKRIIRSVNRRGKLVITATQMLDSMIRNPSPTRAEAADVANAVLDGTDAVMLSGETAAGRHPVRAVQVMDAIVREVEREGLEELSSAGRELDLQLGEEWTFPSAAARAAALLSYVLPLRAIVTFTRDGRSASLIAEHRARAPIVAVTADPRVASRLALEWGVIPRVEIPPEDLEETLRISSALLAREGLCRRGDAFAMVVGWPLSGRTNTVKLHRL